MGLCVPLGLVCWSCAQVYSARGKGSTGSVDDHHVPATMLYCPAMDRIAEAFQRVRREGRTGLVIFLTAGYPDLDATFELVPALAEAGADVIELGVPFSDPMADGVTIQVSSQRALEKGVSLRQCLDLVGRLRDRVPDTGLLLMGYYNPVFQYGAAKFASDAQQAGLDGLIMADLPEEESGPLRAELSPREIALVPLFAPTSTDDRIAAGCEYASGFVYCVSLTGVTGTREHLGDAALSLVQRVRRHTSLPLAVGFGISTREHVEEVGKQADAAVVGSALIRVLMESPRERLIQDASSFVARLRGDDMPRNAMQ